MPVEHLNQDDSQLDKEHLKTGSSIEKCLENIDANLDMLQEMVETIDRNTSRIRVPQPESGEPKTTEATENVSALEEALNSINYRIFKARKKLEQVNTELRL